MFWRFFLCNQTHFLRLGTGFNFVYLGLEGSGVSDASLLCCWGSLWQRGDVSVRMLPIAFDNFFSLRWNFIVDGIAPWRNFPGRRIRFKVLNRLLTVSLLCNDAQFQSKAGTKESHRKDVEITELRRRNGCCQVALYTKWKILKC